MKWLGCFAIMLTGLVLYAGTTCAHLQRHMGIAILLSIGMTGSGCIVGDMKRLTSQCCAADRLLGAGALADLG